VGEVADVLGGDSGHGDTAVLGHVDVELVLHAANLLRGHAREAEHADLVGDVVPVPDRALLGEVVLEHGPHGDDAVCTDRARRESDSGCALFSHKAKDADRKER
jgi:hypothetical protein